MISVFKFLIDFVFRFAFPYSLSRHKLSHTGIKKYQCKYCDRAFTQNNDLIKHLRSHVGTNTYQCDECSEAFRFKSELDKHTNKHYLEQKKKAENVRT